MCKWPVSGRDQERALVGAAVEAAYTAFKRRYGAPRLTVELNVQGVPCSLNHVAALLRRRGMRTRHGKGFRYWVRKEAMTNVNDNRLRRNFEESGSDQKWISNITYIKVVRIWSSWQQCWTCSRA